MARTRASRSNGSPDTSQRPDLAPAARARAKGEGELLDMQGAIACLKTTRATFYRWLRGGRLHGMKVGRQWRFYRHDLERFLQGSAPRPEVTVSLEPFLQALGVSPQPVWDAEWKLTAGISALILTACRQGASDIHIQPERAPLAPSGTETVVRLRIAGVLQKLAAFDARLLGPLLDRFKIMANCNLQERARPQDARIQVRLGPDAGGGAAGRLLDLRCCFLPTLHGEALTLRLLDAGAVLLNLEQLPYAPADKERIRRALRRASGMLLFSGPTGSGKTTSLYACLHELVDGSRKIMSVEDPVEYALDGVVQTQVNAAVGLTFAAALRSFLRSDPDVLMTTEIRDAEPLHLLMQAALTGHLVFSSLHATSAAATLQRLLDMGAEPFLVADTVRLVVAQRLVRKLCPVCACRVEPAPETLRQAEELARSGGLAWEAQPREFRGPVGCDKCHGSGYRGRTVIAEVLEVGPELAKAIRRKLPTEDLQRLAVRCGMTSMGADGVRRVCAGETTLEEVLRVLR
jgi:excisionase family DNA binding protein